MSQRIFDLFVKKYGRLPTERDPDYLELLNMSKYRILAVPNVGANCKCANCGSSKEDGRRYIDFGLDIEWYGPVYICGLCLSDISTAMGIFDYYKKRIADLEHKYVDTDGLKKQGVDLYEKLAELHKELEYYYASLRAVTDDPIISSSSSVEPYEGSTGKEPTNLTASDSESTGTKSRAVKSTSSSRRTDIPSFASLLDKE